MWGGLLFLTSAVVNQLSSFLICTLIFYINKHSLLISAFLSKLAVNLLTYMWLFDVCSTWKCEYKQYCIIYLSYSYTASYGTSYKSIIEWPRFRLSDLYSMQGKNISSQSFTKNSSILKHAYKHGILHWG